MNAFKICKKLARNEDGAVTVDWVVLTAAIVGLAIAVLATIRSGIGNVSSDINSILTQNLILTTF